MIIKKFDLNFNLLAERYFDIYPSSINSFNVVNDKLHLSLFNY